MTMSMITVSNPEGKPSVADVAHMLGVDPAKIDPVFGVAEIDAVAGLYVVQVDQDGAPSQLQAPFAGPWSNPRIESFGPVQDDKSKD